MDTPMPATKRTIFRAAALQRYIEGREKAVLPRFVAPPTFLLLWVMLGLLLTAGAVIALATLAELRPGQSLILTHEASGLHLTMMAVAVGRAVRSPAALQKRCARPRCSAGHHATGSGRAGADGVAPGRRPGCSVCRQRL